LIQNLIDEHPTHTKNVTDEQIEELIEMETGVSNLLELTESDQNQVETTQTVLYDSEKSNESTTTIDQAQLNDIIETDINLPSAERANGKPNHRGGHGVKNH
jgi:hypothetical protein